MFKVDGRSFKAIKNEVPGGEMSDKKIVIKYENIEYHWHDRNWTTSGNITINTSLAQKLMGLSIKMGLLTPEDFKKTTFTEKEYRKITKTEADIKKNDKTKG